MLVTVNSAANYGLESILIRVEVNVASRGFPTFDIVGLPSKAVAESKQRVKTAILNSGYDFPNRKITVNLAPADVPKEGSFFDLPIAVGILAAVNKLKVPQKSLFYGELSLDGSLRHTKGVLLAALFCKEASLESLFIPSQNGDEAAAVAGINVFSLENLVEFVSHITGAGTLLPRVHSAKDQPKQKAHEVDFSDVLGQENAKRALEIAAAGGHNLHMSGPPGIGKSLLAKAFSSILPPLTFKERLEVTKVYSAAGLMQPGESLVTTRQIRAPHHSISYVGMLGGGSYPKPGEISLAHRGVLFLDEIPEFSRSVLESLRQPLEDGTITISRKLGSATFPTRFILISSSNPCPCGYYGSKTKVCVCSQNAVNAYTKRISGPILDRIDLHIKLSNVQTSEITYNHKKRTGLESSKRIKKRVKNARNLQLERYKNEQIFTNSELTAPLLALHCSIEDTCRIILNNAKEKMGFSMRSYHKIIKISRTIADLEQTKEIQKEHFLEAIQYRGRV